MHSPLFSRSHLGILALMAFVSTANTRAGQFTLITHGFDSGATNTNGWVQDMARSVASYPRHVAEYGDGGLVPIYLLYFDSGILRSRKLSGPSYANNPSGDVIAVLDWNPYSGSFAGGAESTVVVGGYVADQLRADASLIPDLGMPLSGLPMHLIGHSRGGSLVCEIARRLGEQGITVDQLTLLDPHPAGNDGFDGLIETAVVPVTDGTVLDGVYENVAMADAYHQTNHFLEVPNGTPAHGAYNRDLSGVLTTGGYISPHSDVHLWYAGTIKHDYPQTTDGSASIGEAIRSSWYSPDESLGDKSGYYFSDRGGGQPPGLAGLNNAWVNLVAGSSLPPNRSTILFRSTNFAANVAGLGVKGTGQWTYSGFALGTPITFATLTQGSEASLSATLLYQADPEGSTLLRLFADRDENPSNGVAAEVTYSLAATGVKVFAAKAISLGELASKLKPGVYRIGAEIIHGGFRRQHFADQRLMLYPALHLGWSPTVANGRPAFNFAIHGTAGRRYVLESSADLQTWDTVFTSTIPTPSPVGLEGQDNWNGVTSAGREASYYRCRYVD